VPSTAAIRWAVREAARRQANLRIAMPGDHGRDDADTAAKIAASADAELLVVAGPARDVDELVMRAYCPVVIVPDQLPERRRLRPGRAGRPRDPRPVVIAAGPATEPEVIAFAFAEAAERRANLLVVRTWSEPLIGLGLVLSDRVDRWDESDGQNREDLSQQLSIYGLAYPDVAVEQLVVNAHCADQLAEPAQRARLGCWCWADQHGGRCSTGSPPPRRSPSPGTRRARWRSCLRRVRSGAAGGRADG
jgi:hypothetical protein